MKTMFNQGRKVRLHDLFGPLAEGFVDLAWGRDASEAGRPGVVFRPANPGLRGVRLDVFVTDRFEVI